MTPDSTFTFSECDWRSVHQLERELGCSSTMAWVLARRGFTAATARQWIGDDADPEAALHDPMLLGDMAAAVERIGYAIEHREPIVVHGDYDCDGVCSTALLVEGLEALGATVTAFLPNRFEHGYGLAIDTVERLARDGCRLLLTVDCGITAVEAVEQARERGIDVIVCDHHQPGPELPTAIICSTRPSSYPFPDLCATAVAGKVLQALGAPYGPEQHELEALATVADCVPMVGENRVLVQRGLRALRRTRRPGLRALMEVSGVRAPDVDADALGFRLAPRINAAGRLGDSERAYHLLRADEADAARLAQALHDCNEERRAIERRIVAAAITQVESWSAEERDARMYVVHGSDWHEGVVGIVAARLVERYSRPVAVLAEHGGVARGSARSVDGFNLHQALASADHLLMRWGGHAMAAGLTVDPDAVPALRAQLASHAAAVLGTGELQPRRRADAIVTAAELTMGLVDELDRLAPFGTDNPRPRLLAVGAVLDDASCVGADASHLRCRVQLGGGSIGGIAFGQGDRLPLLAGGARVDVLMRPTINRFRGSESLQAEISHIEPVAGTARGEPAGWCATSCDMACDDRIPLESVLLASDPAAADAEGPAAHIHGIDPAPAHVHVAALAPVLERADAVDLRGRGIALEHVARLATAGATQLIVCADVARRRAALAAALGPARFGIARAVLASSRCNPLGRSARLHRLAREPGARVVIADWHAVEQVLAGPVAFDAIVVLDPPVVAAHRLLLARAEAAPHLLWGSEELRFAATVVAREADVRGTLASAWRTLREAGGSLTGTALERALFMTDGKHLHAPAGVIGGLRSLRRSGLVAVDPAAGTASMVAKPQPCDPVPAPAPEHGRERDTMPTG